MTKEMILAKLMEMKYDADDTYLHGYIVRKDMYNELVEALKEDIRQETNKSTGNAKPYKLAKSILAPGQKRQKQTIGNHVDLMAYAYTDDDGIKWVVDGYRIAGFYEDIDLPELPEEDRIRWYKLGTIVDRPYDDEELEVPTVGEIKAGIKIAKAEKKNCVVVLKNGITVNANYLLDYLEGFTNPHIYAYVDEKERVTDVSVLRIEADNGIGVLLPIKANEQREPGIYSI